MAIEVVPIGKASMRHTVIVKTRAKKRSVEELPDKSLKVSVVSPPIEGKANQEIIELLAEHFSTAKSNIRIKTGTTSKKKIVEID